MQEQFQKCGTASFLLLFSLVVVSFTGIPEGQRSQFESNGIKTYSWEEFLDLVYDLYSFHCAAVCFFGLLTRS
jgi:hypothetical protein